jgi:hypothetical protein
MRKEVSLLKEAKVFDGDSPSLLNFRSATSGIEALGYLVPNYQLFFYLIMLPNISQFKELGNVKGQ